MSTLEARIAEVLGDHAAKRPWSDAGVMKCSCGERFVAEFVHQLNALHRAHLAEMLAPVIREREAEAWEQGAFDASMSLDHGGHNANNPYRKES